MCVSVSAGLAVSDTARCFPTRWASGSPCGNAPGDQRSGTPDHGSAPAHTKTHTQQDLIRMVVISWHACMCTCNTTPQLYLSMWINQQHVTHGGSLHTTEDILTRSRAALSDQEIPATGEEWLRLLSSYPVMENTVSEEGGEKKLLIYVLGCELPTCHETSPPPGSGPGSQREERSVELWPHTQLSLMEIQQKKNETEQKGGAAPNRINFKSALYYYL